MSLFKIDPKILVFQITRHTCALACLESIYRQHGYPTTQESLLSDYPNLCFVGRVLNQEDISGALYPNEFEALCTALGLQPSPFIEFVGQDIEALRHLNGNQAAVLYSRRFDGNPAKAHYVRFLRMEQSNMFWFMNPTDVTLCAVTAQHLIDWETQFCVLTLPQSFGDA